ncbi:hypothetical protein GCM10009841_06660 [Microlunatus panaciterrae]|uniref:Uncharacterized protein involved in type VI secretion and phage assembly n=1 Tax=Microlunatus panaciterrae TaxID=400768 RepID=A0ABS2RI64_9ACTN|nr:contractile injection system protein, VgrG/Pvc8 family [Microlunatus panaciterrae]MBM7798680.1 uncharacterized protein involved in type VI secretion and phage assembly [Microlunatus panaciterrae]
MSAVSSGGTAVLSVPKVTVEVDGHELPVPTAAALGPVRVRYEVSTPSVCEVDLAAPSGSLQLTHGQALTLRLEGASRELFEGEVVAIRHHLGPDGTHRVVLRGFDRSHRLRQNAPIRTMTDLTVADLVQAVAGDYGLGVDAETPGPRLPRVIQQGQSDLDLVSRLVAEAGLWWQLDQDQDQLRLSSWRPSGDLRRLTWGEDLLEVTVASDATAATDSVRALGWDPVERAVWDVTATGAQGGASVAAQLDRLGGSGERVQAGRIWASTDQAEGSARAELEARARAAVTLRAVVRGDAEWRPGDLLQIEGVDTDLAGPHQITMVEHLVDAVSGYVCILAAEDPPTPAVPTQSRSATVLALAEVVDVEDPDLAGRVRVRLPALDGMETEWLPVMALGAGRDKGLLCQPDNGDTVVLLQPADDPGRGVVLGGLFAGTLPAEAAGVSERAVRRFSFATPDGQRMLLNRDGDAVVISNAAGSRIEMTADAVLLHSEANLTVEAPGRRLLFRAQTIDFERG